jgi:hypothetical protein
VQQGGELAYLIRHDPDFRGVRREHLHETGRRVRLKSGLPALAIVSNRESTDCASHSAWSRPHPARWSCPRSRA